MSNSVGDVVEVDYTTDIDVNDADTEAELHLNIVFKGRDASTAARLLEKLLGGAIARYAEVAGYADKDSEGEGGANE